MKIGIEYKKSLGETLGSSALEKLKSFGFDALDYQIADTNSDIYAMSEEASIAFLCKEREQIEEAGLFVNQVHGPWRWPPRDYEEADRNERMEKMKRSMRMAAALGARYWIVHPLMPFGIEDIGSGKEEETRSINLAFMRELLAEAKKNGAVICLENMPFPKFSIATPEAILNIVKEINDEDFKICLDTGHVATYADLDLAQEALRLGSYIKALHVHDSFTTHDYHLAPYSGKHDWEKFGAALLSIGYEGVFSLETWPSGALPLELLEDELVLLAKKAKYIVRPR